MAIRMKIHKKPNPKNSKGRYGIAIRISTKTKVASRKKG